MLNDIRYAIRLLTRHRSFAATAILTLAIGIGISTTLFAIVNSLLLRPLPATGPERLRFILLSDPAIPDYFSGIRYPDYLELRARSELFAGVLARAVDHAQVETSGDLFNARGEMVSGNYFDVLGVQPLIGRLLEATDDDPRAEPVVMISASLWKARWNGSPDVVGSMFQVDGRAYTIAGVMPQHFRGTLGPWEQTQFWVPLRPRALDLDRSCRRPDLLTDGALTVIARLRDDVSERQAQAALSGLRLPHVGVPAGGKPSSPFWAPSLHRARSSSLPFDTFANIAPRQFAGALLALGTVVLLIATINVGGMLVARGVSRHGEIATRLALGGSRWRVSRPFLVESFALAGVGGLLGLLVAWWALTAITASIPAQFARFNLSPWRASQVIAFDAPTDWRVLLYTLATCVLCGLLAGFLSTRRALRGVQLSTLTSTGASTTTPSSRRLRYWIMAPQICLSVGLLVVAGSLLRSWTNVESLRHGYDPSQLVAINFEIPNPSTCGSQRRASRDEIRNFLESRADAYGAILRRASSIPGVRVASLAESLPIEIPRAGGTWISSDPRSSGLEATTAYISRIPVTSDHFEVLGLRPHRGRFFDRLEEQNAQPVAVISVGLAQVLFGDRSPLGQRVAFGEPDSAATKRWYEVIGIVGDVATPLEGGRTRNAAYVPLDRTSWARTLVARTSLTTVDAVRQLKLAIAQSAPTARISDGMSVQASIDSLLYPQRLSAAVLSAAGSLGLLLAGVGVYGLTAYAVAQRTRELGVRIALGAAGGDIVRLILREGTRVATVACLFGLLVGYLALRLTSARVVALPPLEAATIITAPAVLILAVLLASYIPARRAARIDPIVSLRDL